KCHDHVKVYFLNPINYFILFYFFMEGKENLWKDYLLWDLHIYIYIYIYILFFRMELHISWIQLVLNFGFCANN
ncbi:MAG: hypothetical protein MCS20_01135, partial [Candidatus Phytoplasma mali]|nr:hypothetical protein [Candidatus Phytoplasma mali]